MTRPPRLPTAAGILCLVAATSVAADKDEELVERWMSLYRERAESIRFRIADAPDHRFELHPSLLLKYTNPVRSFQQHGSVHLWTLAGRPAVIASIWSARDRKMPALRNMAFEWHSLLSEKIVAERNGERLWNSDEAGVKWQRLAETAAPAGSRRLRLLQMRRMARSLSPRIETGESELRLMPQPMYRYPRETKEAIDGAVFAFVMGTDPELFVLFEAKTGDSGAEWHVGFARFTHQPLRVERAGKELWSCAKAKPFQRTGRFYLWYKVERLPADLPADASTEASENATGP